MLSSKLKSICLIGKQRIFINFPWFSLEINFFVFLKCKQTFLKIFYLIFGQQKTTICLAARTSAHRLSCGQKKFPAATTSPKQHTRMLEKTIQDWHRKISEWFIVSLISFHAESKHIQQTFKGSTCNNCCDSNLKNSNSKKVFSETPYRAWKSPKVWNHCWNQGTVRWGLSTGPRWRQRNYSRKISKYLRHRNDGEPKEIKQSG